MSDGLRAERLPMSRRGETCLDRLSSKDAIECLIESPTYIVTRHE